MPVGANLRYFVRSQSDHILGVYVVVQSGVEDVSKGWLDRLDG